MSLRDFIEFMCRTEELSRGVSRGLVPGVPAHGAVTVEVLNCQGLLPADTNFLGTASSDPYVVLRLGSGPTQKTSTKTQTLEPVFNESFDFPVRKGAQHDAMRLVLEVWDHDTGINDDFIGEVEVDLLRMLDGFWETGMPDPLR